SRRRHTRFSRDWSSDVCSSDLGNLHQRAYEALDMTSVVGCLDGSPRQFDLVFIATTLQRKAAKILAVIDKNFLRFAVHRPESRRSEERRVGKECRCRGTAYD